MNERPMYDPEAAAFIGRKPRTMQDYRARGGGPEYYRDNAGRPFYTMTTLRAWLAGGGPFKSTADEKAQAHDRPAA